MKKCIAALCAAFMCVSAVPAGMMTAEASSVVAYAKGDVNNDRTVDASDASLVLAEYAAVVNGGSSTFNSAQTECSDVNGDNNIDSSDASVILVYYAESVNNGYAAWPSYLENKIKINSDGLFIADRTLLGKTRSQISSSLGTIIPAPVDFPYWGIGLSNSDCTINGVDVCFMFQNEKCVMIIHDEKTPINKNVFNAAVKFYNDKSAVYSDFSKKGSVKVSYNCTYEIYEDVYATSGQTVYHQQYVSSSMVR